MIHKKVPVKKKYWSHRKLVHAKKKTNFIEYRVYLALATAFIWYPYTALPNCNPYQAYSATINADYNLVIIIKFIYDLTVTLRCSKIFQIELSVYDLKQAVNFQGRTVSLINECRNLKGSTMETWPETGR